MKQYNINSIIGMIYKKGGVYYYKDKKIHNTKSHINMCIDNNILCCDCGKKCNHFGLLFKYNKYHIKLFIDNKIMRFYKDEFKCAYCISSRPFVNRLGIIEDVDNFIHYLRRDANNYNIKSTCNYKGHTISRHSKKFVLFKKSIQCVKCGATGQFFAVEKDLLHNNNNYTFMLYTIKNGKEVAITQDHIIPRSKGGTNSIGNLQTMCAECNVKKGNKL